MADCDLESTAPMRPQSFLFGCELKAGEKEYKMEVDDDESEHQLSLRTVCLGVGANDDLHLVEAEGLNAEGKNMKITLAALKLSVQPTVSLGGFEMAPPVTFRLKSGAGPVYISGQHLIALDDDDLDSDDEDDSILEDTKSKQAIKRPAVPATKIMQKKMKVEDSDDDEEDDEDDDDDDEEDITPAKKVKQPLQKTPLKATPGSKGNPNQNGKTPTKSTPVKKQTKSPESSGKPKTPKTPKTPMTIEEIKTKLKTSVEKGVGLPKLEPKFINYLKHGFRIEDPKIIKELWAWRQTVDGK
ncbi:nucleophosmin-like isoform X1 [Scyliorhinus canicula]|uniref:nucleophosmin-like isoform X1 n=1 Tax=Scyliorhinus canicula TaxID=7830 RepID=UPI0018F35037|nr:nucleophosmin-like isoform X1 [Scyliorhinus canicula]